MNYQLPLNIDRNESINFDNFYWGDNILLEQQLRLAISGNGERLIYIWGNSCSGKSHLLQACCDASQNHPVSYLPLKLLQELGTDINDILDGLEDHALIAIDDINLIAQNPQWEMGLFNLYNQIRDQNQGVLLISANAPPTKLNIKLPDLKSRLSAALTFQIHELNDDGKIKALQLHATKLGFNLPDSVGYFLIQRYSRTMPELFELLHKLDKASLIAKRKLTIPFVKQVLLF